MKNARTGIRAAAEAACVITASTLIVACAQSQPRDQQISAGAAGSFNGNFLNAYDAAIGTLEQAATADHPQLRANAIEALHADPKLVEPYARAGLVDENLGVRFAAAMTIGKFQFAGVAPLLEPLLHDPSESVRAAAIYALRRCGRQPDLNPLAQMLRSDDPQVRANVALILSEMGEPSAAPMIEQIMGRKLPLANAAQARLVDLQLAEALVILGQTEQIDSIRAALFLPPDQQELTALAALIIGRVKDRGSSGALLRLVQSEGAMKRPAEVRMAAMMGLAQIGEPVDPALVMEYVNQQRPEIRQQAAITLGAIGSMDALPTLLRLLGDQNPLVQVAAAGAIVKLKEA